MWLGVGFVRLVNCLPLVLQIRIGRVIGRLAFVFARRDRRIAAINIGLCLPELDAGARWRLVKRHF